MTNSSYYPGVVGASVPAPRQPTHPQHASNGSSTALLSPTSPVAPAPPYSPIAGPSVPAVPFENVIPEGEKLPSYHEAVPSSSRAVVVPFSATSVIAQPGAVVVVNSEAIPTYVDEDGLLIIPTRQAVTGLYCPRCQATTSTIVSTYPSSTAVMSSVLLCWIAPIFSFLPLCMPSCYEGVHKCSRCGAVLGVLATP